MLVSYGADTSGYPATLQQGDSGSFVSELQARLNAAGTSIGDDSNGSFGPGTAQAVTNFRAGYSLGSGAIVDSDVWSKLIEVTPNIAKTGSSGNLNPAAAAIKFPTKWVAGGAAVLVLLALLARGGRRGRLARYRRRRRR